MALRVLLADESSTIKKVIQLSLHDFGVEIKAVANGLDVLSIVQAFQPDLVFVDVLLSKKAGYEVISEIKKHPALSSIPVILMWSGFMQLDEAKAAECKADARLEKPFDAEQLREIVQKLVVKTSTNPVSNYLVFPQMPQFQESTKAPQGQNDSWSQKSLHQKKAPEHNDFGMHRLKPGPAQAPIATASSGGGGGGTEQVTDDFEEINFDELDLPKAPAPQPARASAMVTPQAPTSRESIVIRQPMTAPPTPAVAPVQVAQAQISEEKMEAILRDEVRGVLMEMCRKILPDIAEKIVKEEIQKILSGPSASN